MSEQPAAAPSGGGGKKILGMKPRAFYITMGAAVVAGLAYYWYKNYKASKTAAASTASTATTAGSNNPIDQSGELSVIQTELESLLQGQGAPATTGTTGTSGGTTTTTGTPVTMSLPDGSGGWEQVSFPSQAAVDAWTAWNQAFVNDNHAQAYRSQWNTELTSLGVTRTDGQPLAPPSNKTGNPYDAL